MTKSSKFIYRTLAIYSFTKNFFLRIIALVISVACFYHYKDNPIVTTIVGTLSFIGFLIFGDDEVVIYSDRIKYFTNSILKRYMFQREFYINDIKSFEVKGEFGFKMDVFTDNAPFHLQDRFNKIEVVLRDGTTQTIQTKIYIDKLTKAAEMVSSLIIRNQNSS